MTNGYKNIPVKENRHAILKEEAWRKRTSLSGLISQYADSIEKANKKRNLTA